MQRLAALITMGLVAVGAWNGPPALGQTPPAGAPADPKIAAPEATGCERCRGQGCQGRCPIRSDRGLFKLGQPDQYVPPPSGWTVIVPPLPPPPPKPGAKPPPPSPWKPLFFDNDFRYLDKPENPVHNTFDFLKRRRVLSDDLVVDFGGEFRWQAKLEDNRRFIGESNSYNLFRERLYLNAWYKDRFRTYWEVYWADGSKQSVPPIFTDLNHGDVNNAFVEYRLLRNEADDGWWSARYGWHEELLLGNQRLVSPLDWANARRTFDLIPHALYRGKSWSYDLFWSRPNIVLTRALDQPNYEMQFFGSYLTYRGQANRLTDLYYLGLLSSAQNTRALNGEVGDYQVHTLGFRHQGEERGWLWEVEAAYQFGYQDVPTRDRNRERNAGMATAGLGRRFADRAFKPELWFYYDYASGSSNPEGSYGTFNQLFPLGHKYLGSADLVGRQNILSPNVNLKFYLGKRANLLLWYYNFQLASARDALYNAAGNPVRRDPTGRAGRQVGNEFDIILNVIVNPNSDLQFGYSQVWGGSFVEATAPSARTPSDGSFFYSQFVVRF